jgi:hypothetical protein
MTNNKEQTAVTVKDLIKKLLDYNLDAEVLVVAHHRAEEFSISYGGGEGVTKKNCESVSFYVDRLCVNETYGGGEQ